MKVSEVIKRLEELENQCGDVDAKVVSDDYCMDVHNICGVRFSNSNGYHRIQIVVTK